MTDQHDFGAPPKPPKTNTKGKAEAPQKTTTATQKATSSNGVASSQIRSLVAS